MLVISAFHLKSMEEKTAGLLGTTKPKTVFFTTRFGIHTFFMKYPIDIVILDAKSRVVGLRENLRPNRIFAWNPLHKNVLEMPHGSIRNLKIKIGQEIELRLS
ncbi:MAG: DUF192 domain-containing protein [Candidatus Levybacteria bacterium]|nr:DUF192 domain-containing protein [Candidatus Levybacteria bacterium]